MKKSTIKLIAMLLTVVLMLPNFAGAGALNENEVDDGLLTLEEIEEIGRLEAPATKAYEEIMYAWMDENGNVIYPDTFGGCYLNDDYQLVIKIVNNDLNLQKEISSIVTNSVILVFESTDISRNALLSLQANLRDMFPDKEIIQSGVSYADSAVYVDFKSNDAFINAPTNDILFARNNVKHIKVNHSVEVPIDIPQEEYSNPYIDIPISRAALTAINLNPGQLIYSSDYKYTGTLGWYGTFNFNGKPRDCILVAGHVAKDMKEHGSIKADGTVIFSSSRFDDKNYYYTMEDVGMEAGYYRGDYALLAYDSGSMNRSNSFQRDNYATSITNCMSNNNIELLQGKTIYKSYGISGTKMGTVESTSVERVLIANLFSVEVSSGQFCSEGDSGAPVCYTNSSAKLELCGIVTGYNPNNRYISYCTPIYIPCDKGFSPYLG